ncbi:MAG TPA: hypothetical protein VIP11_12200 [Gemmatimonadaceae bacterium]
MSADLITIKCVKCGAYWWAVRLDAGDVRAQLLDQFDGDRSVLAVLDAIDAPAVLDRPMYWQLWITGNDHYRFTNKHAAGNVLESSREMMRRLAHTLPLRAS